MPSGETTGASRSTPLFSTMVRTSPPAAGTDTIFPKRSFLRCSKLTTVVKITDPSAVKPGCAALYGPEATLRVAPVRASATQTSESGGRSLSSPITMTEGLPFAGSASADHSGRNVYASFDESRDHENPESYPSDPGGSVASFRTAAPSNV